MDNAIEQVCEDGRDQEVPDAEREGCSEDEAVSTRELDVREDTDARSRDRRKQEGRDATQNRVRDYKRVSDRACGV